MDLKSPSTMLVAWALVPALIAAACWGLGAIVERFSAAQLGPLRIPAGFCTGIVLMSLLLEAGLSGRAAVAVTAPIALLGLILALTGYRGSRIEPFWRDRSNFWIYGAALAAYALALAPLAGSGRAGVLGYILNNDPSVHLSAIELIRGHGTETGRLTESSFGNVTGLFATGYPLGSDVWPMFGAVLAGIPAFYIWTPAVALTLTIFSLVTIYLVRVLRAGPAFASVAGLAVALGYLPYSYAAQGGAKEVAFVCCFYATVAFASLAMKGGLRARRLIPALIGAVATIAVFGPGGVVWIGPPAVALAAWLGWRERRRLRSRRAVATVAVAVLVALVVALPSVLSALEYARSADDGLADQSEVGNLIGPVPWTEAFNVWLNDDYRDQRPYFVLPTRVLIAFAIVTALFGLAWLLVRRRFAIPIALGACLIAIAYLTPRYSIYIDAKTYLALAPALGLCSVAGVLAFWVRGGRHKVFAGGVATILLLGLAASNALVYTSVWMTPKKRFAELIEIADRVEGRGPLLLNEREDYGKYFLRDAKPWESWGAWIPDRGLRDGLVPAAPPHTPDFDDYRPGFLETFNLLVERRRPGGSLPPINFHVWFKTEHYTIWRRKGPYSPDRFPLGRDNFGGTASLNCADPGVTGLLDTARASGQYKLGISYRSGDYVIVAADSWNQYPAPWERNPFIGFLRRTKDKQLLSKLVDLKAGMRYRVFLQGSFAGGFQLFHNGKPYEQDFADLGLYDGWHDMGTIDALGGGTDEIVLLGLNKPKWQSGFNRRDLVGHVVFQPVTPQRIRRKIEPSELDRYCGKQVDWVELLLPG